jgi:hypothetical protein
MMKRLMNLFRSKKQPEVNVFKQASIRMLQNSTSNQRFAFGQKKRFGYDGMKKYFINKKTRKRKYKYDKHSLYNTPAIYTPNS